MASAKKRPDGQWRARYRDSAGKEHAKHFTRKVDAQRWLDEVTASIVTGRYVDPRNAKVSLRQYAGTWLAAQAVRDSSRRTYRVYLDTRILPALGDYQMGRITTTDVRGVVSGLQAAGLAPNTVHQIHGLLATLLRSAVDDGYIARTPCVRTAPPKAPRGTVRPLSVDEVEAIRGELPDRYVAALALGAGCGLRLGEALGLKAGRVHFLERTLQVVEQLTLVPGSPPRLGPPKTRASVRTVALPNVVAEALASHLAQWPADADELLFRSRTGSPLWPNTFMASVWRPAVKRAGLPASVRFHDLRHFYASLLIHAGESVKAVQEALGHASATETLNVYSHLWPGADTRARAAVDSALSLTRAEPSADSLRTEGG